MVQHPRILVATDNLRDQINGVAVTFKHLAIAAESAGYQMCFMDPAEFHHFSMPGYKEVKLAIPFGIGRQIDAIRPDHIHIATEGPIGLATKLYCDRNNIRYNTSYHTKFPEYLQKLYGVPLSLSYAYLRWFHKHSGRVLTTTESMRELLLSQGFSDNIVTWSRGVDTTPAQGLVRKPNGSVLYVGRVSAEKNLPALLELQDEFHIVVVGDGPERAQLEAQYPRVTFLGYRTGAELFQCYLDADVFCFPSKTDTFGIVIIEALSQGTPVAAYPVTGPLDIITPGVTGVLDQDLASAIRACKTLERRPDLTWTWQACWEIFRLNLV